MAMYALAISSLVYDNSTDIKKIWYADDAGGVGKLETALEWWKILQSKGPSYGFHSKSSKSLLVVKK